MIRLLDQAVEAIGLGDRMHMNPVLAAVNVPGLAIPLFLVLVRSHDAGAECGSATTASNVAFGLGVFLLTLVAGCSRKQRLLYYASPSGAVVTLTVLAAAIGLPEVVDAALYGSGDAAAGVPMARTILFVVCSFAFGAALGATFIHWSEAYARMYVSDIITLSMLSAGLGVIGYMLAAAAPADAAHGPWVVAIGVILVAVDAALLHYALANPPATSDDLSQRFLTFHARRGEWALFLQKITLPTLCVGIVMRVFFSHLATVTEGNPSLVLDVVSVAVMVVVAMMVICFGAYHVRRFGHQFSGFLAFLIPLIALISVPLTPAASDGTTSPLNPEIATALCALVALTWSFIENAALGYLLLPAAMCALTTASVCAGFFLGTPIAAMVTNGSEAGSLVMSVVCLLMALGFFPPRPAPNLSRSSNVSPDRAREDAEREAGSPGAAGAPEAAGPFGAAPGGGQGHRKGRFQRRCQAVADLYQLSPREAQVLVFLGKGRSISAIKDELAISEGTAKTHINHVYKKLDVHSRNELIELIESMPIDER